MSSLFSRSDGNARESIKTHFEKFAFKDSDVKLSSFSILRLNTTYTIWTSKFWTCWAYNMKSFIAKRVISILVNLRYLRFKLLKYKENNKKICNTFDHNFKYIPLYIMSNVSLERYYFVLYDGALTLKISKMALNAFCDKTLHFLFSRLHMFCDRSILNKCLFVKHEKLKNALKTLSRSDGSESARDIQIGIISGISFQWVGEYNV